MTCFSVSYSQINVTMGKQYEKDIKERTLAYAVVMVKETLVLKKEGVEYALRDQLLRSGTSIGANVREAKASSSRRELIRYYEIALRSCEETEFWMNVIQLGYEMSKSRFESLLKELNEITRVLVTIINNLKK